MTKGYVGFDVDTRVLLKKFLEALLGIEKELEWIRKELEKQNA